MMHHGHHTQLSSKKVQQLRKYHLDEHSLTFCNFTVTLTLNTTIQFFHKTLWLMTMYYQTSSSKDTVAIVIF